MLSILARTYMTATRTHDRDGYRGPPKKEALPRLRRPKFQLRGEDTRNPSVRNRWQSG